MGRVFLDARETALFEGDNVDVTILVFADNFDGFGFGVEGIHEEKGKTGGMVIVETFDLTDGQVQETHPFTDFDGAFGTGAAHGGTEATVEFEDSEFVEYGGTGG